jgi:hypothetical protein
MEHALVAMVCVAAIAGHVMLISLYRGANRRLKTAEANLAAKASGLHELVAENIEMEQRLDKLQETELAFFALRREHARTSSTLEQLARVEAGLRLELSRLHERHLIAKA